MRRTHSSPQPTASGRACAGQMWAEVPVPLERQADSRDRDNGSSSRPVQGVGTLTHGGPGAAGMAGSLLHRKQGEARQLSARRKHRVCPRTAQAPWVRDAHGWLHRLAGSMRSLGLNIAFHTLKVQPIAFKK